jgi:hypothetical protein
MRTRLVNATHRLSSATGRGRRAISQQTAENPLLSLLLAAAVGDALTQRGHGQRRRRNEPVLDYDRTSRGYAPHRDGRLKR